MSTSLFLPDLATPTYDPLLPLAPSITAIGTVSRATQLGLFATTTVTETTTVLQLVYFREPATTASSSHNSTASNVQQALEKVADQYEGSTLAELGKPVSLSAMEICTANILTLLSPLTGSMAAVFLIVILIGTVAFVFSINYARRARTMVEGGSEEAWAEVKEHAPLIRGEPSSCAGKARSAQRAAPALTLLATVRVLQDMSATPRDRMMACMVLPVPGADETIRSHAHSSVRVSRLYTSCTLAC